VDALDRKSGHIRHVRIPLTIVQMARMRPRATYVDTFPPNLLLQDPNGRSLRGFDL